MPSVSDAATIPSRLRPRILYAKGGRAIAEAARLFPVAGALPPDGPDQFLLAARFAFNDSAFRLVSVGPQYKKRVFANGEALEYGLRPTTDAPAQRALAQSLGLLRFAIATLRWRPTVLLSGIEGPMALVSLGVARLLGARYVLLVHTDLRAAPLSPAKRRMNQYVAQHADAIIVHGPFLRDQLLKLGCAGDKLFEFDTGFDPTPQLAASAHQDSGLCSGAFLYAGRVEANKGVFDLLQAYETLAGATRANLVFAGNGSDLERLRQQAAASRYAGRITVPGAVPHAQLLRWMQQALVTVTPTRSSLSEGRCMSALESLLVGTPVIAPELGAFPYLVKHGENGLLYTADSVTALIEAMTAVTHDADLLTRLRTGAQQSGKTLMQPARTFLQCLLDATRTAPRVPPL